MSASWYEDLCSTAMFSPAVYVACSKDVSWSIFVGRFCQPGLSHWECSMAKRGCAHACRETTKKKSLPIKIMQDFSGWECRDVPNSLWTSTKILVFAAGLFYHLCLPSAWGNSNLLSPSWGIFRTKVVLVWIQSHLVHGRWIWLRVGTMSVIDILLFFSLKVHGCYFTTSFEEIDYKSMFFVLPRPYLQK